MRTTTWTGALVLGALAGGIAGWWAGRPGASDPVTLTPPTDADDAPPAPREPDTRWLELEARVARLERAGTRSGTGRETEKTPETEPGTDEPDAGAPQRRAEWEALRAASGKPGTGAAPSTGKTDPIAELRRLEPAARWEQVADELQLSAAQVEDLRTAVRNRDLALQDARVVSIVQLESGGRMRSVTLDPDASRAARAAFDDRLDFVLDADQRAAWRRRSLGRAFGERPQPAILQPLPPDDGDDDATSR